MVSTTAVDSSYCIDIADVEAAVKRIAGKAHETPVLTCRSMNQVSGGRQIFLKMEALQKTGSFKFRGATNAVQALQEQQRQNATDSNATDTQLRVVTHSSGNHAQALALAAKHCQGHATIVMPTNTPTVKKQAVADFGGEIVLVENTNEAREGKANEIQQATGAQFVHPSENPLVIAGQGTVCMEFLQQTAQTPLDVVIIPVGGGGLAAGNCVTLRAKLGPNVQIVLAEPHKLNDAYRSFQAKELLKHAPDNKLDSVADGLKTTLGPNTWPIIRDMVDQVICVSEEEILRATLMAWQRLKVCIEPSAGVGLGVALYSETFRDLYPPEKYPNVGIILCGGNVDVLETAAKMKTRGIQL